MLRKLPAGGLRWLFTGSLPVAPFLRVLSTRNIAWLFPSKPTDAGT